MRRNCTSFRKDAPELTISKVTRVILRTFDFCQVSCVISVGESSYTDFAQYVCHGHRYGTTRPIYDDDERSASSTRRIVCACVCVCVCVCV
jgi:hypothetical protein